MEPSFSMETAQGRKKTSVLIFLGSMPGPSQNQPVSLGKMLTLTSQSSSAMASLVLLELAPEQAGFMPHANSPLNWPLLILSNRVSQEYSLAEPESSRGR